ncbi:hypothetical protein HETIRDRAFT_460223 [Heterobasidion irregulare TC 32-1]|uniref:Uncharacterized protein n=1 Tax=Heterobasidion irregulare (strain TC 32-1) TaxID=747525 RepID=W4JW10_HETIT|nr:uncharacterized protein HETIRDRAFT_460223 [Heterobasidion irregulare TC 32-1]ETW77737.1 hypothetical protein HETIRDRAFT_460223 [Heterobasidion irregulare TC 32-1]
MALRAGARLAGLCLGGLGCERVTGKTLWEEEGARAARESTQAPARFGSPPPLIRLLATRPLSLSLVHPGPLQCDINPLMSRDRVTWHSFPRLVLTLAPIQISHTGNIIVQSSSVPIHLASLIHAASTRRGMKCHGICCARFALCTLPIDARNIIVTRIPPRARASPNIPEPRRAAHRCSCRRPGATAHDDGPTRVLLLPPRLSSLQLLAMISSTLASSFARISLLGSRQLVVRARRPTLITSLFAVFISGDLNVQIRRRQLAPNDASLVIPSSVTGWLPTSKNAMPTRANRINGVCTVSGPDMALGMASDGPCSSCLVVLSEERTGAAGRGRSFRLRRRTTRHDAISQRMQWQEGPAGKVEPPRCEGWEAPGLFVPVALRGGGALPAFGTRRCSVESQ